jgi:hypothetical protein
LSHKPQQPFPSSEFEIELHKIDLCWHQGQTGFQEGYKSIRKIAEMLKLSYESLCSTKYIIKKMMRYLGHLNGMSYGKLELYLDDLK